MPLLQRDKKSDARERRLGWGPIRYRLVTPKARGHDAVCCLGVRIEHERRRCLRHRIIAPLIKQLQERARRYYRTFGDAESLLQDTLLRCWEQLPPEHAAPLRWAYCAMRFLFLKQHRHQRSEQSACQRFHNEVSSRPIQGDISDDDRIDLMRAIDELSEPERLLIEERYFEGRDCDEIAHSHGVRVPRIHLRLHRIRKKIAASLARKTREPRN